ncbi:MAG: hypothetical protein ACXAC7_15865 [Candidatus Hodarchaeales archaeon]|jgi:Glu-tRNA(Gln) amidotransferase subunit E-like FAD-binding protein
MVIKIPGLSHELRTEFLQGKNYLILSINRKKPYPMTEDLAQSVIYSGSRRDIEDALTDCLKNGGISHQVLKNTYQKLINDIIKAEGFTEQKVDTTDASSIKQEKFKQEITKLLKENAEKDLVYQMDIKKKLNELNYDSTEINNQVDKIYRSQSKSETDITELQEDVKKIKIEFQEFVSTAEKNFQEILSSISVIKKKIDQAGEKKGWFK